MAGRRSSSRQQGLIQIEIVEERGNGASEAGVPTSALPSQGWGTCPSQPPLFQLTKHSPSPQKASRSSPHPTFSDWMKRDVTLASFCLTTFCKKKQFYTTMTNVKLTLVHRRRGGAFARSWGWPLSRPTWCTTGSSSRKIRAPPSTREDLSRREEGKGGGHSEKIG